MNAISRTTWRRATARLGRANYVNADYPMLWIVCAAVFVVNSALAALQGAWWLAGFGAFTSALAGFSGAMSLMRREGSQKSSNSDSTLDGALAPSRMVPTTVSRNGEDDGAEDCPGAV
jgi:Na+/H+-translocating membrane pyrophosphatase